MTQTYLILNRPKMLEILVSDSATNTVRDLVQIYPASYQSRLKMVFNYSLLRLMLCKKEKSYSILKENVSRASPLL